MDIDKLSLRPSEIDKNTGRIVLPKSQEELDRLSGRTPGMNVSTRVKAYMPGVQRPAFPQPGVVQSQPAGLSIPVANAAPLSFWQHPFYGILGFCALVAAIPIGFFCLTILRENGQLRDELSKTETYNAVLVAQQKAPDASYTLTALNQEMAQIRSDVAQLSSSGIEVYFEEEVPTIIENVPSGEQPLNEPAPEISDDPPQASASDPLSSDT